MTADSSVKLLALVVGMVLLAAALLLWAQNGGAPEIEQAREFQALTGGLGFGPALDLSSCPPSFDPRLSDDCPASADRLLGRQLVDLERAGSIFYFPQLQRESHWSLVIGH
jgi:hypothetical protein